MNRSPRISAGQAWPMGAHLTETGLNLAVFSADATQIECCLFSEDGTEELSRIPFAARSGDIWHMHLEGLGVGTVYGLRASGPFTPATGQRFNRHKLLLDPYAKALKGALSNDARVISYQPLAPELDLSFNTQDSAPAMPKAQVVQTDFDWEGDRPPAHPLAQSVIYEAHVKALTKRHPQVPPSQQGRYLGLCSDPMIAHFQKLGVTAVELLPVQAFVDEHFLLERGLSNHWGYNTLAYFAPEPRYGAENPLREFQTMVKRLHQAGIEVILDVVYNHSAESDELGPTFHFRGLDNTSYYHLEAGRYYQNATGTGNMLDLSHPMVLRLVMDSLRYWVETCHVDGFRFDLAPILARDESGFNPRAGFFAALLQDPVLSRVKLIAEPWDIGLGGYQLGAFPAPFSEWNDGYRDDIRRFWRGDEGMIAPLAARILASAAQFDHHGRAPQASVNFITAHDGFTLQDLVSFNDKHNLANGEDNRDGHNNNHSDNLGHEGLSDDPQICAARDRRKRNLLATLLLGQGLPMLLAGDELGHSQGGNNNAYAQDNETTWINWACADHSLIDFVAKVIALRKTYPALRQGQFLHADRQDAQGLTDVIWRRADGSVPQPKDWQDPQAKALGVELRVLDQPQAEAILIYFNAGPDLTLTLPVTARWQLLLDTTRDQIDGGEIPAVLPGQSVLLFRSAPSDGPAKGETK